MSAFQVTIEALARATGLDLVRLWRLLAGESPRVAAEAVAVRLAESSAEAYLRSHIMVAQVVADAAGEAPETPVVALDHFTSVERLAQSVLTAAGYEWVADGEPDDLVPEPEPDAEPVPETDPELIPEQDGSDAEVETRIRELEEVDRRASEESSSPELPAPEPEPDDESEPLRELGRRDRRPRRLRLKEPEKADTRLERLGRSEVAQAAQMGVQEAMQANSDVIIGWARDVESDACQMCVWWTRLEDGEPRVWPVTHPMPIHVGCVCTQRPIIRAEYPYGVWPAKRSDRAKNAYKTLNPDGTSTEHAGAPPAEKKPKKTTRKK